MPDARIVAIAIWMRSSHGRVRILSGIEKSGVESGILEGWLKIGVGEDHSWASSLRAYS